jgi:hypothetical protein
MIANRAEKLFPGFGIAGQFKIFIVGNCFQISPNYEYYFTLTKLMQESVIGVTKAFNSYWQNSENNYQVEGMRRLSPKSLLSEFRYLLAINGTHIGF